MSTIINPYIAGSPVTGSEMFFDREDVFEFIHRTLIGQHRDNVIVLYGQRRTGKTSVLYQMPSRLSEHYLCVFIDLHSLALEGLGGFLWELANHIVRVLRRNYQIDLSYPNRVDFMTDPRSFFRNEFLNQVWSAIGDRHILLMLDEAIRLQEQVQAGKLEYEIFEYLRHLMQHYEQLNFLFSLGSGLEEMEKEYAFLFNVGLYKKISFLDQSATSDLITQPIKDHYQVEPAAVERIYHITSGHPYHTQLVCHCLFNRWGQQHMSHIGVRDVDEVLDEVVERGSAVLKYGWEELTAGEKAVVAGLAAAMGESNRAVDAESINRAWRRCNVIIPEGEMAKAIRSLIARDFIVGQEKYAFTVDLQRLWVQKYRRIEWVKEEIADLYLKTDRLAAEVDELARHVTQEKEPPSIPPRLEPVVPVMPPVVGDHPPSKHRVPSSLSRIALVGLVLLVVGSSVLFSLHHIVPVPPPTQQVLHLSLFNGIQTLDPALANDADSVRVTSMVFIGLVQLDDQLAVQPALAQSWETAPDRLTWTFHLRPELKFSDGTLLTAEDVVYSLNRALQPATHSPISLGYLQLIKDAEKLHAGKISTLIGDSLFTPDEHTVQILTNKVAPYFLETLTYSCSAVVEQKLIDAYGAKWTDHLDEGGGAGPFTVSRYQPQQEIDLVSNRNYEGPKPRLQEVSIRFYDTVASLYQDYQGDRVEEAYVPWRYVGQAWHMVHEVHHMPTLAIFYLAMNYLTKPFDDIALRQAFALALDKDAIVHTVFQDIGSPTNHIIPLWHAGV